MGHGPITGSVTQCLKPGQLSGLGIERVLVYRGQTLKPHRHWTTEALLIVVRGNGFVTLGRTSVRVRKGDVISVPPRTIHGFATRGQPLEFIAIQRPSVCRGRREDLEVVPRRR